MIREKSVIARNFCKLLIMIQILALLPISNIAVASTSKREIESTKAKVDKLQKELNKLAGKYQVVYHTYLETLTELKRTNSEIEVTKKRLNQRKKIFSRRLVKTYKYGSVGMIEVLFGSNSFSEMVTRLGLLQRIAEHDVELLDGIKKDQKILEDKQKILDAKSNEKRALTQKLKGETKVMGAALAKQQKQVAALQAKFSKEEKARMEAAKARMVSRVRTKFSSRGSSVVYRPSKGFIFPVAGARSFSNDWGQPRSGGRRHRGTDVFASYGTPLVAVVSGTVKHRGSGLGGMSAYLTGSDGNSYYYTHMSRYGKSGRVNAGEVIGYVGTSGNARGTSPHVHFEIWPGGSTGRAINPYHVLRAAS